MVKVLVSFIALSLATTASAHTGLMESSILHHTIHIVTSVGIYLAMIALGFYLLNKLSKAKRQRIKTDRK